MSNPNPEDVLMSVPDILADHFELDGVDYSDGHLHVKNTISVPVKDEIGPDAAAVLDDVAKAAEDKVFTKSEVKRIGMKCALLALKHQGVGKFLL